ncbi:MAG TPA: hypothetical protein VK171_13300 [Fimbriimonas sp.]|nr:hypothetical protein [Fimbriimonas sp.]
MSTQQELIQKIESFEIDAAGAEGAFAARLAKEQKWTPAFTAKVIREYKRFIALAMISNREVTPSKTVDEAWHLHLIFTDSYWNRLAKILPKPLHHHPGMGAKGDRLKYKEQFRYTLELYRDTFGADAPADVWGAELPPERTPTDKFRLAITAGIVGLVPLLALTAGGQFLVGLILFGVITVIGVSVAYAAQNPRRSPHVNQSGSTSSCGSTGCGSAQCGDTSGAGCGGDGGGGGDGGSCGGGCGGGGD